MLDLERVHETLLSLETASVFAFVLAALAGLLLALTPTVLATVPVVMMYVAGEPDLRRWKAFTRSLAFVLGTATTFGAYGLIFGWAGTQLAPLFGSNGYLVAGTVMVLLGLAMLGKLRLRAPPLFGPERKVESLAGSYALGLPFGLVGSACPCSIPVVLTMLLYAGSIGSAWFGAAMLFVFALVRGLPLVLAGTFTGLLKDFKAVGRWQPRLEKASGVFLIALGAGFVAQRFGTVAAAVAAGIAALSIVIWLLATALRDRADHEAGPKDTGVPLLETEIRTPGMVCEGCAATLSSALLALQAVHKVVPDVNQKRVRVFYNPQRTSEERLRRRVEEMGFL
ncbi:MAG: sulfite exporter TauE/SafE family protein [Planctomycetia bacterium]|nr:sulfite exporter TauE/SafE family protein [Planctomycetia bacterium]